MLFTEPEKISLDERGSELFYYPKWNDYQTSQQDFKVLKAMVDWQQDEINLFGKKTALPRKTAWYGDMGISYQYSGIKMTAIGWTNKLLEIKARVEQTVNQKFNSVLLNYYRNGQDSMGWHSDDEPELGETPTIASLSLGETRHFDLREKQTSTLLKSKIKRLLLESGSLLVMTGNTQRYWQHRVAKQRTIVNERINLTFRWVETTKKIV